MSPHTVSFLKKVILTVVKQAFAGSSALSPSWPDVKRSIIGLIAAGVLSASFVLILCYVLFIYLVNSGLAVLAATLIVAGIILLFFIISLLIAYGGFTKALTAKKPARPIHSDTLSMLQDPKVIESLLLGILAGFTKAMEEERKKDDNEEIID
jgi:hypothetical protein